MKIKMLLALILLVAPVKSSKVFRYLDKEPCFGKDCDAHKKHRDKYKPKDHQDWFDNDQFKKPTKKPPQDEDCIDCFNPPFPDDQYEENKNDILSLKGGLRRKFAFECMEELNGQSAVCSPLSALKPLGMLAFGAEGKTLNDLLRFIGVSSKSEVKKHFKNILKGLTLRASGLHMASRIYIEDTLRLRSIFKKEAEDVFGSCIEQVNFKDRSKVAYEVNSWVEYHTNKKISSFIKPSDVLPRPIGFIVDAIYFWGRWKYPFRQMRTDTFLGPLGERTVTMMCNIRNYNYGFSKELESQVIEIPYQDREMKLIVLLPRSIRGLGSLIKRLKQSPELINNVVLKDTKIQLELPKFKVETSLNLKNVYNKTGLKEMFEPNQGFTKVVFADEAIYVDMAVQKAFLVLDQEGTEAGGATLGSGMGSKRLTPFIANHPFMFFITMRKQQLFAGVLQ